MEDHITVHKHTTSIDDLKAIHGIGAAVENRLNDAGYVTYEQLGEATPAELAAALKGMVGFTGERIQAQDWIQQARRLGSEIQHSEPADAVTMPEVRQHYAVFTIEFLLEQDNQVRRTHILNVRSQQESAWAGWKPEKISEFISESANLNLLKSEPGSSVYQAVDPAVSLPREAEQPVKENADSLRGSISLLDWCLEEDGRLLKHLAVINRPFDILVDVDFSAIQYTRGEPLYCEVVAYARGPGSEKPSIIGRNEQVVSLPMPAGEDNEILSTTTRKLRVRSILQAPGEYYVDVVATLRPAHVTGNRTNHVAGLLEGIFIQAYEGP